MSPICTASVNSLVNIWTALHRDLDVEIDAPQKRQLHQILLGLQDDLLAMLLEAKLSSARHPDADAWAVAACGREVCYSVEGQHLRGWLVHGTVDGHGRIGIGTRFGLALLGLRPGQSLLWPRICGRLAEVTVQRVGPGPIGQLSSVDSREAVQCAFG